MYTCVICHLSDQRSITNSPAPVLLLKMAIILTKNYGYDDADSSLHVCVSIFYDTRTKLFIVSILCVVGVDALLTVCLKIVDFSRCGIVAGYVSVGSGVLTV